MSKQQAQRAAEAESVQTSSISRVSSENDDDFFSELDEKAKKSEKEKLELQYELEKVRYDFSIQASEIVRRIIIRKISTFYRHT
jgi:hypothetical protein